MIKTKLNTKPGSETNFKWFNGSITSSYFIETESIFTVLKKQGFRGLFRFDFIFSVIIITF